MAVVSMAPRLPSTCSVVSNFPFGTACFSGQNPLIKLIVWQQVKTLITNKFLSIQIEMNKLKSLLFPLGKAFIFLKLLFNELTNNGKKYFHRKFKSLPKQI